VLLGRHSQPADGLEHQDHVALGDPVPDVDPDLGDGAGGRRRHVHGRLVRLQGDDRVVDGHGVARRDMDLDDGHVGEIADSGDANLD